MKWTDVKPGDLLIERIPAISDSGREYHIDIPCLAMAVHQGPDHRGFRVETLSLKTLKCFSLPGIAGVTDPLQEPTKFIVIRRGEVIHVGCFVRSGLFLDWC